MKLNELVALRLRLESIADFSKAEHELNSIIDRMENLAFQIDDPYKEKLLELSKVYKSTVKLLDSSLDTVDVIASAIDQDIADKSQHFFASDYQKELEYTNPDNIRQVRRLHLSEEADQILLNRVHQLVDWRYPALEIGCRDGKWTQQLVAADPLYITDIYQEFLDTTAGQFSGEYQHRLRKYLIQTIADEDGVKEYRLVGLPKEQFNLVFSWNFFNYLTLENIQKYLVQIYELLRPGGVFIFTFNNGDISAGAAYAENYYMSYVPRSMLVPVCEQLGFEIIHGQDLEPAVSWLEIRRPGELKTVKASQAMGAINRRNI
jgi:SAM-dependent methyltransferase